MFSPILLQATVPISNPSATVNYFQHAALSWVPTMTLAGQGLFVLLGTIGLSYGGIREAIKHSDWRTGMQWLTLRLIAMGFFLTLLSQGTTWMFDVINGFDQLARTAGHVAATTPSQVFVLGLNLCTQVWGKAFQSGGLIDPVSAALYALGGLLIMLAFGVCTISFMRFQLECWLAVAAGFWQLGLGAVQFTEQYALRYLTMILAAGVRWMVLLLLIGAGQQFAVGEWTKEINSALAFNGPGVQGALATACECLMFAVLCWETPQFVSGYLSGALTGSAEGIINFVSPMVQSGIATASVLAAPITGGVSIGAKAAASAAGAAGNAFRANWSQPSAPRP